MERKDNKGFITLQSLVVFSILASIIISFKKIERSISNKNQKTARGVQDFFKQ